MQWLKETLKQWIPTQGWLGRNFISLTGLVMIAVILGLLNGVFGVVSFSWLDLRLELFRKWFKQSKLPRYFRWGLFKPIRVLADDIDQRTRVFPGKHNLYLLPFSLSAMPSNEWIGFFESALKVQQDRGRPGQQVAISNQEVVVVSSETDISETLERLSNAASSADEEYLKTLDIRLRKEYENQRLLIALSRKSPKPDISILPETVRTELKKLGVAAAKRRSKWSAVAARSLGVLTIVMCIGVLMTLGLAWWRISNHPDVSLPDGLHGPGMAIQLAHNPQEVDQIVKVQGAIMGAPADNTKEVIEAGKSQLRENIRIDWFVILYYTLTLGLIAFWLGFKARSTSGRLAFAGFVSVLVASVADILENWRILSVLNEEPPRLATVNSVLIAATVKWAAIFIVLGIFGRLLLFRKLAIVKWTGFLMLVTLIVGAVGVIRYRIAVEWGFWLMAITFLLLGLLFIIKPKKLEGR